MDIGHSRNVSKTNKKLNITLIYYYTTKSEHHSPMTKDKIKEGPNDIVEEQGIAQQKLNS